MPAQSSRLEGKRIVGKDETFGNGIAGFLPYSHDVPSLPEVVVAWLVEQKHTTRPRAALLVFVFAAVLGTACALVPKVFNTCDFISSNVLMMAGALIFSMIVGWIMPRETVLQHIRSRFIYGLIRYAAPVMIVAIAVTNLL